MEPPLSLVTGAITISKQLYELAKKMTDREIKHQLDEIGDKVRELKPASALEDENRELREQLRFKSDAYEFRHPFWYDKAANPDRALCPKCHAKNIDGPMGEQGQGCHGDYRRCLVCGEVVEVSKTRHSRRPTTYE